MSASQSWLNWFKSAGRPSTRRHPASPARLGSRLCRLEPLEQRMVLSAVSPVVGPFEIVSLADSAPGEVVTTFDDSGPNSVNLIGGDGAVYVIGDETQPGGDSDAAIREQTREAIGEDNDGPMAKMGWELTYLYFEYQAFIDAGGDPAMFSPSNTALPLYGDCVAVGLSTVDALTYSDVDEYGNVQQVTNWNLVQALEATGLTDISLGGYSAGGLLPFATIADLASLESVTSVWPAYSTTADGPTISGDFPSADTLSDEPTVEELTSQVGDGGPGFVIDDGTPSDGDSYAAIRDQARAAFGVNKDGPMAKMGWELTWLYFEYRAAQEAGNAGSEFSTRNTSLPVVGDFVAVELSTIEALTYNEVDEWGDVEEVTNWKLVEALEAAGLTNISLGSYSAGGLLPFAAIDDMATLDAVKCVWPAYSVANAGATTSQGDIAQQSDAVRTALVLCQA